MRIDSLKESSECDGRRGGQHLAGPRLRRGGRPGDRGGASDVGVWREPRGESVRADDPGKGGH